MELNYNYFYFDIFSKRIGFFFNNHEKISSRFGLFLTIIYIISSLSIFFYYLIILIQRKEIKVYDKTIYTQKMPVVNINSDILYFAFGLEHPNNSIRYIDESIYYPQILYIERVKINGEFKTMKRKSLEYERCKEENFGKSYQHFFIKNELNNSYCLKKFNNFTFAGGYKYGKMNYIRIKIFPCKNTSENNNHCKPQEIIDYYLTSSYFSILIKDFGLNPTNYSFPVIPTLQDLYTTIDKRLSTDFILYFGVTEIHTDSGLLTPQINTEEYLHFRQTYQTFFFREIEEYLEGNEICVVQLKLDDTIFIQERKYTKISEIFSKIGGFMQIIYTIFSLISLLVNKFHSELKIMNTIFKFNLKENKMKLKFKSFDLEEKKILNTNKDLIFTLQKNFEKLDNENSKNKLFKLENNNISNLSSGINVSDNKKIFDFQSNQIKLNRNKFFNFEDKKNDTLKSKNIIPKINLYINDKEDRKQPLEFKDHINLNLFYYLFCQRDTKIKKHIELFDLGNSFYRKRMDVVHAFTLLLITEKILLKSYKQQIYHLYKENESIQPKNL